MSARPFHRWLLTIVACAAMVGHTYGQARIGGGKSGRGGGSGVGRGSSLGRGSSGWGPGRSSKGGRGKGMKLQRGGYRQSRGPSSTRKAFPYNPVERGRKLRSGKNKDRHTVRRAIRPARIRSSRGRNLRGFPDHDFDFDRGRGFGRFPFVVVPYGYGYSNSTRSERVVIIDHTTATRSNAVVDIVPARQPLAQPTVEPKVFEVRPEGPRPFESARGQSVEVSRVDDGRTTADEARVYLLAFKDETVVTSRQHWLEGDTMRFVTPKGKPRQIRLADVDLDLTARLNSERGLSFSLEVVPQPR